MVQYPNGFCDALSVNFIADDEGAAMEVARIYAGLNTKPINLVRGESVHALYCELITKEADVSLRNIFVSYDERGLDEALLLVYCWSDDQVRFPPVHVLNRYYGAEATAMYRRLVPSNLKKLLGQLQDVQESEKAPDTYFCRCPAHNDKGRSLWVRQTEKGIVMHCNAGCDLRSVLLRLDTSSET